MLNLLLAQDASAAAEIQTVAQQMQHSDTFSAAVILSVIGVVAVAITVIVSVTSTIQRIIATRMAFRMISELSQKGYSADEVERLVYGDKNFSRKVKQMFRKAKGRIGGIATATGAAPTPPIK